MLIYVTGAIIAIGFFVGIYWADQKTHDSFSSVDNPESFMIVVTVLLGIGSWISVIAMITHQAFLRDQKEWNTYD